MIQTQKTLPFTPNRLMDVLSIVLLLVFVVTAVTFWVTLPPSAAVLLTLLVTVIVAWCIASYPRAILLEKNRLVIVLAVRRIVLPYSELRSATVIDRLPGTRTVRLLGSGGFFGFTGLHYTPAYGRYHLFARKFTHLVLVEARSGKKYMLSSPRREEIVRIVNEKIKAHGDN